MREVCACKARAHVNLFKFNSSPIFKCYLFWSSLADWLQILCAASWGGSLPKLEKLCWFNNFFIFANLFFIFFRLFFKCYLLCLLPDYLQISCEASWGGFLLQLWKLCWLTIFCNFFIFSAQFSNAVSSEVCWSIDFKLYVRYPGEGLYKVMEGVKAHRPLVLDQEEYKT